MTDVEQVGMSIAEYMQLPETTQPTELIDGELIVSPSPTDDHQDIVLSTAMFLKQHITDGKVKIAPTDCYLDGVNVVQPDVFWGGHPESRCQLDSDKHWQGPPDLAVEVLSSSTAKRDREVKYTLYETAGVREYWIIDPVHETVEVYVLDEGHFKRQGVYAPEDTFTSPVLNNGDVPAGKLFT